MDDYSGLLRTSTFGGFNKKDVYNFFEKIKEQSKKEIESYKAKMMKLATEYENLQEKLTEQSKQVEDLSNKLGQAETENQQLNERISKAESDESYKRRCELMAQKIISYQSEIDVLNSQINEFKNENDKLKEKIKRITNLDFDVIEQKNQAIDTINLLCQKLFNIKAIVEDDNQLSNGENTGEQADETNIN